MSFEKIELEKIFRLGESSLSKNSAFVMYSLPGKSELQAVFCPNGGLEFTFQDEAGFVMHPFDKREKSSFFPLKTSKLYTCVFDSAQLQTQLKSQVAPTHEANAGDKLKDGAEKERYMGLVGQAKLEFKAKRAEKIVLSRPIDTGRHLQKPFAFFASLLEKYPQAYCYFWSDGRQAHWMGASPETLLSQDGLSFQTMSLAGTKAVDAESNESGMLNKKTAWTDKEYKEQALVTEQIKRRLSGYSLEVEGPNTIKAGRLLHLCSLIKGRLGRPEDLKSVVSTLHPTAAVCGLPSKTAAEFILENEAYDRHFYSGFLGSWRFPGRQTRLFVNLRCLSFDRVTAAIRVYVGAGITEGSIPVKEWEETEAKSQTMLSLLNS